MVSTLSDVPGLEETSVHECWLLKIAGPFIIPTAALWDNVFRGPGCSLGTVQQARRARDTLSTKAGIPLHQASQPHLHPPSRPSWVLCQEPWVSGDSAAVAYVGLS